MNSSNLTLDSISAKIRLNQPLSPAEVALYTGVKPKTVTGQWIRHQGLQASKVGSRTILIEPNAFRCWLIDMRIKNSRLGGGLRKGVSPVSKIKKPSEVSPSGESSLTATDKITNNGNLSSKKED